MRASTLPCSIKVLASVMTPEAAQQMCESISNIFSMLSGTMRVELSLLSTARTTPSGTLSPTADEPSWIRYENTLMASIAYSTWKILPSGEKVLIPLS